MTSTNTFTLAICVLTIVLLGVTGCHHRGDRRHGSVEKSGRLTDHIVSELDLTTTQETLLNEIAKDLEEAKRDLGDHDEFKKIFVTQLANDDLDEKYLRKETARLIQGLENASETFITHLGAFHASLSDEQKEKLVDLANHKQGHRRWRN